MLYIYYPLILTITLHHFRDVATKAQRSSLTCPRLTELLTKWWRMSGSILILTLLKSLIIHFTLEPNINKHPQTMGYEEQKKRKPNFSQFFPRTNLHPTYIGEAAQIAHLWVSRILPRAKATQCVGFFSGARIKAGKLHSFIVSL